MVQIPSTVKSTLYLLHLSNCFCAVQTFFHAGVINLTDSLAARQRWAQNHYVRTEIYSDLLNHLCIVRKEDVSREVKESCIKTDTSQLMKIIDCIESCNNPFTGPKSCTLHNLSTGKAAQQVTQNLLLNIMKSGRQSMKEFIQRCAYDPGGFERPIKKEKISTFAEEGLKVSKRVHGKIQDIKMQRDTCGRLLMLSLKNKIDMKIVFQYPLSIVPLVFGQTDGSMNHTPKSTLIKALIGNHTESKPKDIDAYVVDGFFFLHLFANRLPMIYEDIIHFLLVKIVNFLAKELHLHQFAF